MKHSDLIKKILWYRIFLKAFLFFVCSLFSVGNLFSQNSWTPKTDFGGTARDGAVSFSIGSKGYLGTGYDGVDNKKDFWEYDPATNAWTQKANFGGVKRTGAVGFSIGTKGYIGLGADSSAFFIDFWEYDAVANTWTAKANFTGTAREGASGFVIGTKAYVGCGVGSSSSYLSTFYEWDQTTNTWTAKTSFPSSTRAGAFAFSIGSKGYLGGGGKTSTLYKDFYEYDPSTNAWTSKAQLMGGQERTSGVAFTIGNYGYAGMGYGKKLNSTVPYLTKDIWLYDPANNSWKKCTEYDGTARAGATAFAIGNKAYVGSGFDGTYKKNFSELDVTTNIVAQTLSSASYPCNGASFTLSYTAVGSFNGGNVFTAQLSDQFGNFDNSTSLGSVSSTSSGSISCSFSSGALPTGSKYRIRVTSNNPVTLGTDDGQNISIQPILIQKANFGGGVREHAAGFTIGTKAYIGTGNAGSGGGGDKNDFWEWDQATDVWTQKANFGGAARADAVGFSIGTKGYIGTGGSNRADFWEWDQATNTWTQKAGFAGAGRGQAVGFAIGTKGYIGTGIAGVTMKADFWEWDQATNAWSQIPDLPGGARAGACAFVIGNKGYVGTGTGSSIYKDLWEWNPVSREWVRKSDMASTRIYAMAFSLGTKGYVAAGHNKNDFWEWDQERDAWTQLDNIGNNRARGIGFSINNNGYIGLGRNTTQLNDFWEYSSCGTGGTNAGTPLVITGTITPTSLQAGETVTVPYTAYGNYNANNKFFAQLSDPSGSFVRYRDIGYASSTSSGNITAIIPNNIPYGTNYRIRVFATTNLTVGNDNGVDLTITPNIASLSFDGTDDRVTIPSFGPGNLGTGAFTFEAWVNLNSSTSGNKEIISNRTASVYASRCMFMVYGGNRLLLQINGVNSLSSTFTSIYDNNCHHIAVTRSGSTVTFYVDGVAKGTASNSHSITNGNDLFIGYDPMDNASVYGTISDVRIWNVARTSTEISSNMSSILEKQNNLWGYWLLNEAMGQNVLDKRDFYSWVAEYDGFLGTSSSTETIDPVWVLEKCFTPTINTGVDFDGVDDIVTVEMANIIGTGDFTFEASVKIPSGATGTLPIVSYSLSDGYSFNIVNGTQLEIVIQELGLVSDFTISSNSFSSIYDNQCHHVAAVRNSGTVTFYLDGVAIGGGTRTNEIDLDAWEEIIIGRYEDPRTFATDYAYFEGTISDLRIWRRARTATQISDYKAKPLPYYYVGDLLVYLNFKEETGSQVVYNIAGGNNGFLGSDETIESYEPTRVNNACFTADRHSYLVYDDTSSTESFISNVELYPNPFNNESILYVTSDKTDHYEVKIFDIHGRVYYEGLVLVNEPKPFGQNLPLGIYFVEVIIDNERKVYKTTKY